MARAAEARVQFVANAKGERIGVILDIDEYNRMLADPEELESIKAYDKAKASGEEAVRDTPIRTDGDLPE